jgi:hypothetical protein
MPGYPSEALAAAAYDHVCIWQALRTAQAAQQDTLSPLQLQAAIQGLTLTLNHPVEKYTGDAALLAKLSRCSRQQLQDHLQPFHFSQWAPWAAPAGSGNVVQVRRDNTTRYVGVSHISNSKKMSAAITGALLAHLLAHFAGLSCW